MPENSSQNISQTQNIFQHSPNYVDEKWRLPLFCSTSGTFPISINSSSKLFFFYGPLRYFVWNPSRPHRATDSCHHIYPLINLRSLLSLITLPDVLRPVRELYCVVILNRESVLEMESGGGSSPSYYSILGVSEGSSDEELRRAYRKLAMQWHPDKWTKNPSLLGEAKRRFQQIQEAYSGN